MEMRGSKGGMWIRARSQPGGQRPRLPEKKNGGWGGPATAGRFNCSSPQTCSAPSLSDLHFNMRAAVSGMPLEGVRMINHLKSKILITGCNFCYLRSPLVSRKEKKNIYIAGYSPFEENGRGGLGGRGTQAGMAAPAGARALVCEDGEGEVVSFVPRVIFLKGAGCERSPRSTTRWHNLCRSRQTASAQPPPARLLLPGGKGRIRPLSAPLTPRPK